MKNSDSSSMLTPEDNFPQASSKEQLEADSKIVLYCTSSSGRPLWSMNLSLSVTLSTRHVLIPLELNNIKPEENLRKIEGRVRWKPCESRKKTLEQTDEISD